LHLLTGSEAEAALLSTFSEVSHGSTHTRAYFEGVKPDKKVAIVRSVDGKDTFEIAYDYLIICTGVPYISPIRASKASIDFQDRILEIDNYEKKIHQSNKVVVVGGGLVGVELAAELVSRRKASGGLPKEVLLLSRSTLLGAMPKKAGDIAKSWLSKQGVELILGDEIANICLSPATSVAAAKANRQTINTKSGRIIEDIDVIVDCTNKRSDLDTTIHSKRVLKENVVWPYNDKGFVEVNENLQSTWDPSIFAAGDVIELCSGVGLAATTQASGVYGTKSRLSAVRNAHLAESQAELVAENILCMKQVQRSNSYVQLKTYPQTPFYGSNVAPLLACVSLGPHNGIGKNIDLCPV
jgi:NADH dehydrogenase FAD-containing subunit